ncbi:MAG: hypothetical protein GEU99_14475 [Luteitalea sp.]|nr:hypothetical protein [Luteitalea sp.]
MQNTPWSGDNRHLVALQTTFQDRMPRPGEAAAVVLVDAAAPHRVEPIEQSRAWNFQQGTMFYWNPAAPDRELFFNDRDEKTQEVFTVRYDIAARKRIREYRFSDTPFGNGGVAQRGGYFLGLNYGRLARLRLVTGYPGARDWTIGQAAPERDGIFRVDIESGEKRLLVSFAQLAAAIEPVAPHSKGRALFINHTLGNRDNDRIYFYVRADFDVGPRRVDVPCSIRPDGTRLLVHSLHIGGHPEWDLGTRLIGSHDGKLVLYDVDARTIVGTIGDSHVFPDPGGDTALSPDGHRVVNGYRQGTDNLYVVYDRRDGSWARTPGFSHVGFTSGELRVDGSPSWNRSNDAFQFPAIAADGTRQMFLARIVT